MATEAGDLLLRTLPGAIPEAYAFRRCRVADSHAEECRSLTPDQRTFLLKQRLEQESDPDHWQEVRRACGTKSDRLDAPVVAGRTASARCSALLAQARDRVDAMFAKYWTRQTNDAWMQFGARDDLCRNLPNCHGLPANERTNCFRRTVQCGWAAHVPQQQAALYDCMDRHSNDVDVVHGVCGAEMGALVKAFEDTLRQTFNRLGVPDAYSVSVEGSYASSNVSPHVIDRKFHETNTAYENAQCLHELLRVTRDPRTVAQAGVQ